MEQFELTVFRQSRILIAIFVLALSLPGAVYLATLIDGTFLKILLPLLSFITIVLCSFYSVYGELTVMAKEDKLFFIWTKKFIFNFSPIADVHLSDIQKIVLDKNEEDLLGREKYLTKIVTSDRNITIGTSKFWKKDVDDFIWYLKRKTNARITDSWESVRKKGSFKPVLYLMNTVMIAGALLPIWIIFNNGLEKVEPHLWAYYIPSYFVLYRYRQTIKDKMKENWW